MRKLITDINGEMPIHLDDIRFMQKNTEDDFGNILKGFNGNFVLWGCKITVSSNTINIDSGAVVIDNQIYEVDEHSVIGVKSLKKCYLVPDFQMLPEGKKIFGNGEAHDTYKRNVAILKNVDTTSPKIGICIEKAKRFDDQIAFCAQNSLKIYEEDWHNVYYKDAVSVEIPVDAVTTKFVRMGRGGASGYADTVGLRFKKDALGWVHLDWCYGPYRFGDFEGEWFTLPEGYHPNRATYFNISQYGDYAIIQTDGKVIGHVPEGTRIKDLPPNAYKNTFIHFSFKAVN